MAYFLNRIERLAQIFKLKYGYMPQYKPHKKGSSKRKPKLFLFWKDLTEDYKKDVDLVFVNQKSLRTLIDGWF